MLLSAVSQVSVHYQSVGITCFPGFLNSGLGKKWITVRCKVVVWSYKWIQVNKFVSLSDIPVHHNFWKVKSCFFLSLSFSSICSHLAHLTLTVSAISLTDQKSNTSKTSSPSHIIHYCLSFNTYRNQYQKYSCSSGDSSYNLQKVLYIQPGLIYFLS